MDETLKQQLAQICTSVLFDEPMSKHTSIRIGGPADAFVYPKTIDEITTIVKFTRSNRLPVFVLGAGSNLLVRDKGIRGVALNLSQGFSRIEVEREEVDEVFVYAETGVGLPRLVDFAAEEGLTGLEVLSGIPGNVGGALFMNAGTHEGDISKTVESVTFIVGGASGAPRTPAPRTGNPMGTASRAGFSSHSPALVTWPKEEIRYGYRESHFPRGAILLSARFRLTRLSSEIIRGRIQKQRNHRLETQPLNLPSLGSIFKNPAAKKLFAAKMIEDAGLKDVRVGGARISQKHSNWIVNEGGARAKDILTLISLVRDKVKEKFGVLLETEVKVVGEE